MISALALLVLLPSSAQAGAWTRDAGSYYTKAGADGYWALRFDQLGTAAKKSDSYLGEQYSLYGEAGLSKGHPFQVAAGIPLSVGTLWFRRSNPSEVATGRATVHRMGDLRVIPQVALHPDKPIALALETKIPAYQVDSICEDNPQFQELCPRPGDGQIDLTGWVLAGAGFDRGFIEGGIGYLHRTELYMGWDTNLTWGDSVAFTGGGGMWFGPALAMLKLDGNVAPAKDPVADTEAATATPGAAGGSVAPLQATPQSVRLGPGLLVDISEGIAFEARAQVDVWALNTANGLGFGLGLSARK
jgi:hypothetical protein